MPRGVSMPGLQGAHCWHSRRPDRRRPHQPALRPYRHGESVLSCAAEGEDVNGDGRRT